MVASIGVAANYFCRDSFTVWNPTTNTFTGGSFLGRFARTDTFVSLWNKSTRRQNIYVRSDQAVGDPYVVRRDATGDLYLVTETVHKDFWLDGTKYFHMLNTHSLVGPSGGAAQFFPVRVVGSGDDLGPVVFGPAQLGYADAELRTIREPDDSERETVGEYFLAFSRNFIAEEGDYLLLNGRHYRLSEEYHDSGYHYSRATREQPAYTTLDFKIRSGTPAVYDPVTGTMTALTESTRQVSALVGQATVSGNLEQRTQDTRLSFYIYHHHVGFPIRLGMEFVWEGRRYTISKVNPNLLLRQWSLEATRQ